MKMSGTRIVFPDSISVLRSILIACTMFLAMCAHYIFKAGVQGLVIKMFHAKNIPWLDIAETCVCLLLVAALFLFRRVRLRLSVGIGMFSVISAIFLFFYPLIFHYADGDRIHLFIIWLLCNTLVFTASYSVWMLVVTTAFRKSWLTLAIVGLGAQLGVWCGAWIGKYFASVEKMQQLPIVIGLIYVVVFLLVSLAIRRFSCGGIVLTSMAVEKGITGKSGGGMPSLFSYVGAILLLILLGSVYGRTINWRLQMMADYKTTVKDATFFLGDFYQLMAFVSLLCQLILTPLALKFVRPGLGLFLQPVLGILMVLLVMGNVGLSIDLVGIMAFTSIDYTVYNAFKEKLWLHVPLVTKVYHKAIAALLIPKIADLLNALSIIILASYSFNVWTVFVMILALSWAATVFVVATYNKFYQKISISDYHSSLDDLQ